MRKCGEAVLACSLLGHRAPVLCFMGSCHFLSWWQGKRQFQGDRGRRVQVQIRPALRWKWKTDESEELKQTLIQAEIQNGTKPVPVVSPAMEMCAGSAEKMSQLHLTGLNVETRLLLIASQESLTRNYILKRFASRSSPIFALTMRVWSHAQEVKWKGVLGLNQEWQWNQIRCFLHWYTLMATLTIKALYLSLSKKNEKISSSYLSNIYRIYQQPDQCN